MALRSRSHPGRRWFGRLSRGRAGESVRSLPQGLTSSGKKTRFLDADEIERGIGEVARLATEQGVHVALIGGAALQLLGFDRLIKDIDFAADRMIDGLEEQGSLEFGGIKATTSSGVPVDLVIRDDKYRALYEAAVDNATRVEGVPVFVVSGEYLIAMKMVARSPKDDADLEFLIGDGGVDLERARTVVSEHLGPYALDELERYCDEVAWRRSRGSG